MTSIQTEADFEARLQQFAATLLDHITDNGTWKIKGIIDSSQQIYALSLDTKTLSKFWDDYWKKYKRLTIKTASGEFKQMTNLEDFVRYNGGDTSLIVPRNTKK